MILTVLDRAPVTSDAGRVANAMDLRLFA